MLNLLAFKVKRNCIACKDSKALMSSEEISELIRETQCLQVTEQQFENRLCRLESSNN